MISALTAFSKSDYIKMSSQQNLCGEIDLKGKSTRYGILNSIVRFLSQKLFGCMQIGFIGKKTLV